MTAENIEELVFELTYIQHGGSGLGWTRRDALECEFFEASRMVERLYKRRKLEADAIRRANKGKR